MSADGFDDYEDTEEEDEGLVPGDRVVIQVVEGTHTAEVSGTVLMVRHESYLDTESVNLTQGILGYSVAYETLVQIAGLPGLIDITDLDFEIIQEED
jgi:hypothetical protein